MSLRTSRFLSFASVCALFLLSLAGPLWAKKPPWAGPPWAVGAPELNAGMAGNALLLLAGAVLLLLENHRRRRKSIHC